MNVWLQKLSEIWTNEKCLNMYLAMALNRGHLAGAHAGNPYSILLYFTKIDYDTNYKPAWRQFSFDTG